MSAFLGPIHYWLYNKIQLQQDIVHELFELGNQHQLKLETDCNREYGVFLNKPLEEMIDHGNIHGWLQEQVSQAEYKYAYCVIKLLKQDSTLIKQLSEILYRKGQELGRSVADNAKTAPSIYKLFNDNLLDGMPCDHANSLISQSDDEVIWKRNLCVHQSYWEELDGDISNYYELRNAWMKGMTQEVGFSFNLLDPVTYSIHKAV